ncbi:hypothetical protein F0U44_11985 [Nocardioides humilatus]|uniref:tRNA_anti-like n=1 Tax=Nocardioides humilatus TaxID=2607660 RepID=A0A5B1LEU1_9ACTN|nr:hypothetical protein [Nocardioides humilatus]KAA1419165.1 hypothetical protein F0U44_11985 [Nocardioides humilatus]
MSYVRNIVALLFVVALIAVLTFLWVNRDGDPRERKELSWKDARSHVGDRVKACGPVAGVGRDEDDTFINVGFDFPDKRRLTIIVWDQPKFRAPNVGDVACATGKVTRHTGVPEIDVEDLDNLEIRAG